MILLANISQWPLGAFLFGGLAFFVSLGTLSVAWMNYKTASDKLRLDLFEKRFRIYQAVVKLIDTIGDRSKSHRGEIVKFWMRTRHHKFLFKQDIHNFMGELRIKYTKIQTVYEKYHSHVPKGSSGRGLGQDNVLADIEQQEVWFDNLKRTELIKLFEPYLAFYHTSDKLSSIEDNLR